MVQDRNEDMFLIKCIDIERFDTLLFSFPANKSRPPKEEEDYKVLEMAVLCNSSFNEP